MPKISIVLPTYNGSRYLLDSVHSCLTQTMGDLELIIVDDGSTDATPSLIASIEDPRVLKLRQWPNRRLPAALNLGFRHATSRYLTWTSDDNLYAPEALHTLVDFLDTNPECDFVYSDYWTVDTEGAIQHQVAVEDAPALDFRNVVGPCFLYTRDVYQTIGEYDETRFLAEDYDYWQRIHRCFRMTALHTPLYFYREHNTSLTNAFGEVAIMEAKAQLVAPRLRGEMLGTAYINEAFRAYQNGDTSRLRTYWWKAVRQHPALLTNFGVWSIGLKSVFPHLNTKERR